MALYVCAVPWELNGKLAYHMYADTGDEMEWEALFLFQLDPTWRPWRYPNPTNWPRYAISPAQYLHAIERGAQITDRWGPGEFVAMRQGDWVRLGHIERMRAMA